MDVREKLEVIAHLGDHIIYKEDIGICYDSALAKVIEDAYMELKNGVTVQSGIDTNTFRLMRECERLKEEKESLANAVNVLEEINSDLFKQIKGVTVQEWISTDERMPTEDDAADGYVAVVYDWGDGVKTKTISLVDVVIAYPDLYDYWMPFPNLPQPPKGE